MSENTKPFEEMSLNQLRELLVTKFEFKGADLIPSKALAVTIIETLEKKLADQPLPVVKDNVKEDVKHYDSKAAQMKALCESEPKVRFMIPLDTQEKRGAVMEMQINGFKINVLKGVMVDLYMRFAKLYEQHLNDTAIAGQDLLMDRDENVKEKLS